MPIKLTHFAVCIEMNLKGTNVAPMLKSVCKIHCEVEHIQATHWLYNLKYKMVHIVQYPFQP